MELIYTKSKTFQEGKVSGFCPGCMHDTVNKLIGEVLDELDIAERTVCLVGVGCGALNVDYINYDVVQCAHGRACASASGMKRVNPDTIYYTYQGDGDLAAIGLAETVSAANRGENFTVVFINNGTYGMTGGQLAPTTLIGMKATTTPNGRIAEEHGYPLHVCELLASLKAPAFLARTSCNTPANVRKTKNYLKKAFQNQLDGKGFSLVEVVTSCPTNLGMDPIEALDFLENEMIKEFPLGIFRDR